MNLPSHAAPPLHGVTGSRVVAMSSVIRVFLAALGPMVTVSGLPGLVMDVHGGSPAAAHAFVALGMLGSAIGAPLLAARADRTNGHGRMAVTLAVIDAAVAAVTASTSSVVLVFALRAVHGAASMGLLALLFGELRRSSKQFVAQAGGAMIAALAIGPALGGALARSRGAAVPFQLASGLAAFTALSLLVQPLESARVRGSKVVSSGVALYAAARKLSAPLLVVAAQRLAIGGFVTAFAVRARTVHGFGDARVGASFSAFLLVFAAVVVSVGRKHTRRTAEHLLPVGGLVFGASLFALAVAPAGAVFPLLGAAGAGAGLVYAPCLAIVSDVTDESRHASSMALLHAAGAVGMIVGPLAAALIDISLPDMTPAGRGTIFLALAGGLQVFVAAVYASPCRALAAESRYRSATSSANAVTKLSEGGV